ncbi:hypothetical protein [Schleiferilactobacillus shenzhenensis]|uniref:Uncharacterized protein n=1 Tax=Schleiferilactobacillus shenzhenensis LY-73 TaxID=1231336 RepID=U4TR83_9LACO|nr:hypothetical protein [Schleiferilactobacillus shenzhenensis]ERL64398.1 hypothetical protein L248_0940 [Schleiferilactobacillus shenzhenensis LY-73]
MIAKTNKSNLEEAHPVMSKYPAQLLIVAMLTPFYAVIVWLARIGLAASTATTVIGLASLFLSFAAWQGSIFLYRHGFRFRRQ